MYLRVVDISRDGAVRGGVGHAFAGQLVDASATGRDKNVAAMLVLMTKRVQWRVQ
jgi:hypothetical protein